MFLLSALWVPQGDREGLRPVFEYLSIHTKITMLAFTEWWSDADYGHIPVLNELSRFLDGSCWEPFPHLRILNLDRIRDGKEMRGEQLAALERLEESIRSARGPMHLQSLIYQSPGVDDEITAEDYA